VARYFDAALLSEFVRAVTRGQQRIRDGECARRVILHEPRVILDEPGGSNGFVEASRGGFSLFNQE
jgi:hypothetical protein